MTTRLSTVAGLRPDGRRGLADRLTASAICPDEQAAVPMARFWSWWRERRQAHERLVRRVPLGELDGWQFDETGLGHRSGRFFRIAGIQVRTDADPVGEWDQPIIDQPEIGILGFLVKEIGGVVHCLVQAKVEPGNPGGLQLSPTVQATRSNYLRVHGGARTRYLEYFADPARARPLVDVLQSEQNSRFLAKRNRNVVVETDEDVVVHDDFCWLTFAQLRRLLRYDNLVNMDARTVLSCVPFTGPGPAGGEDEFGAALRLSALSRRAHHTGGELLSWLTAAKATRELTVRRIPLPAVRRWRTSRFSISHDEGRYFRVVGVDARIGSREVTHWMQPMVEPCGLGVAAWLVRRIAGIPHVLVGARTEAGTRDVVELAPTVQYVIDTYRQQPASALPPFADYLRSVPPERVRYDVRHSEEGGRFLGAVNRYLLVEVEEDFPLAVPPQFAWVTLNQLMRLVGHSYYLNVEARTLLACANSLW
ncbi:NDP-hexose 2,3-dehydratase family protein [Amycolatopsis vastitatis]|uniref:NDP-hexose 2,3-dehydratase n=1 Tax=Amycolatopsis vastitatis TaxID=1905142 RepID=A0A229TEV3_9PSEU|nr:NDP-hexose 2,3-dehydratase family protein [Amycolatopsis vastitatis]OXM69782.1 NDP-hexose 2,3-dehydratase [Amycolatopsis vastitatis]